MDVLAGTSDESRSAEGELLFRRLGERRPRPPDQEPSEEAAVAAEPALSGERAMTAGPAAVAGESLHRVTAEAAHDFNNLLSVIITCAYELEGGLGPHASRERVAEIRAAAERGARLTRQMIETTRTDSGSAEASPTAVNDAIRDAARLLERTLGPGIELVLEPAAGLPCMLLGPDRIEQTLLNLAANARDAVGGAGVVTVRTGLRTIEGTHERLGPGWYVTISLSDTGPGMSEGVRARALDPYFTTKNGGGSGLGLATVARIARGAGGDVEIESAPGAGTTVSMLLPAVRSNGDPLALRAGRAAVERSLSGDGPGRTS